MLYINATLINMEIDIAGSLWNRNRPTRTPSPNSNILSDSSDNSIVMNTYTDGDRHGGSQWFRIPHEPSRCNTAKGRDSH